MEAPPQIRSTRKGLRPNSMTTTTNMVAASRAAATANTGLLNPCRPQSPCRLLRSNTGARLPAFTQLPTAETVRTDGNAELPVSATTGTPGVSEIRWQCGGALDAPKQQPHTRDPTRRHQQCAQPHHAQRASLQSVHIQRDTRAKRRRHRTLLNVSSLRTRRLQPCDLVKRSLEVFSQLVGRKRNLTNHEVHIGVLVNTKLNLSAFDVGHSFRDIRGNSSCLRVRHEPTRSQHLTQTTNLTHELRRRHSRVECGVSTSNLFNELSSANFIGPRCNRRLGSRTGREHDNARGFTRAVRQDDRAANHLIGFPRVNPELQRDLDGRVTLCRTGLFCERDRVGRSVKLACLDLLGGGAICLRFCSHCVLSLRLIRP